MPRVAGGSLVRAAARGNSDLPSADQHGDGLGGQCCAGFARAGSEADRHSGMQPLLHECFSGATQLKPQHGMHNGPAVICLLEPSRDTTHQSRHDGSKQPLQQSLVHGMLNIPATLTMRYSRRAGKWCSSCGKCRWMKELCDRCSVSVQIGNFAVWINNDTEYAYNIAAFSKTYKEMADQLPFFIWRDASVQHFSVCTNPLNPPSHCQHVTWGVIPT